ncbi:spermidine synthase [Alicyclobacillus herbarius]|uniref:spermidine synthase n=1 Tax=Alicyclobacillus herbarius TaxID=122960 RepID=UPI00040BC590|nr:hypothetical protein [Alicyclobacillus herbarius]
MSGFVELERRGQVHPQIQVVRRGHTRYLRFGRHGGWQGALDLSRPWRPVFPYQRAFSTVVAATAGPDSFFCLGIGTGTALRSVRRWWPNCRQVGVELDEIVLELAFDFFDIPPTDEVRYYVGDGISFLQSHPECYDLMFIDAYMRDRIYSPCLDPSFVSVIHQHLGERGTVALNIIMDFPLTGVVAEFLQALVVQFGEAAVLPVGFPGSEQNCLVVASRAPAFVQAWRRQLAQHPCLSWYERWLWPWRLKTFG